MQLPSINLLILSAKKSATRFTASLTCAFLIFIVGTYWVYNDKDNEHFMGSLMMTLALGVPLFFSLDIWAETKSSHKKWRWLANGLGLLVLTGVFFSLPLHDTTENTRLPYVRYALYSVAVHLLVSIAAALRKGFLNGFWQYNKDLFVRLFVAIIYAGVICIGLELALVAISALFGADIEGEVFMTLFIFCASVLNIWFFLSGINPDIESLEQDDTYPKVLKFFTQFILLSLLVLYLVIIYCYGIKIIFSGDWPKGVISYMIMGVSVLGYLTNLLLFPLAGNDKKHWLKTFYKVLYIAMIPLTFLLFYAVAIRIDDYGITVNRYYIVLIGLWILFISIFQTIRTNQIKVVPISLAILAVLSSFGPWGASSVSERSQVNRLETILTETGFLVDGKVVQEHDYTTGDALTEGGELPELTRQEMNEISSILDYLDDYHRFSAIQEWFRQDLNQLAIDGNNYGRYSRINEANAIEEIMGLEDIDGYDSYNRTITLMSNQHNGLDISGYDFLLEYERYSYDNFQEASYDFENNSFLVYSENNLNLCVTNNDDELIKVDLNPLIEDLRKADHRSYENVEPEELTMVDENSKAKVKIIFTNISYEAFGSISSVNDMQFKMFIKLK